MEAGLRSGEGTFYFIDGRAYRGQWKNDEKNGYGVEEGVHYYEGQWKNGLKDGNGVINFDDHSKYEGSFLKDYPEGYGIF